MKTPLSPSQLLENGHIFAPGGMCQEMMDAPAGAQTPSSGQSAALSLCQVCNLQLTSPAQAQLHYNGRSHLRRVRQLQTGDAGQVTAGVQSRSLSQATGFSSRPTGLTPIPGLLSPGLGGPSRSAAGSGGAVGGSLPALIGATGPSVMMKPFLPFPVETTTSPVGIFPNFNTMDPVQKAVINHTFGVTMVPKKKQVVSCNVCQLRFNSDSQAEAHYRGSRHAKKLKSQENKAKMSVNTETNGSCSSPAGPAPPVSEVLCTSSSLSTSSPVSTSSSTPSRAGSEPPPSSPPSGLPAPGHSASSSSSKYSAAAPPSHTSSSQEDAPPSVESEEEKAKKLLYCSLCKVAVNSLSQLEAHNTGSKHKTMLEARSGSGPIRAYPRPGSRLKNGNSSGPKGSGLQNQTFHCQICDVHVNSEIQLKQHISSRRHKDRVAGKPSKPKYSPYNKQQRTSKELGKSSLSPSFLSSPFAPPSSSLPPSISLPPSSLSSTPLLTHSSSPITPTLSLHPRPPASSSLFTTSFLRPAPGPIRTGQGSILFAPY